MVGARECPKSGAPGRNDRQKDRESDRSFDQGFPVVLESARCWNPSVNRGGTGNRWFEMTILVPHAHKTARLAISLGVAISFATVSVSVHAIHTHAGAGWDTAAAECCTIEYSDRASCVGAICITDDPELEHGPRKNTGPCLACLFLKNCKVRVVVWQSPAPVMASDRHTSYRTIFCQTTPDIVSSSPRAPPLSHS